MTDTAAANEEIALAPSQTAVALRALIRARQPVFLHGQPGIGKSQVVQQTARALGLECQDVRAVLLDPVDLRGLPHVNGGGRAHWAIPEFLPREGKGVLFLDELNRAPVLVQNACFQLILDRKLGEYALPDGWTVVAAGNRESDGGGIVRMPSALANRFVHLNVVPDLGDWSAWALGAGIDPLVIAFLRWKPELLCRFDRQAHAYPTPRSWEFVSTVIGTRPDPEIELALVAGAVGHGAAMEFMSFVGLYRSLPSIDAILLDPQGADVPTEISALYAVSAALAHRTDDRNVGAVMTYLERLPQEYNVFAVRDMTVRDKGLTHTPEFIAWATRHQGVL